jgi:plastocyanin
MKRFGLITLILFILNACFAGLDKQAVTANTGAEVTMLKFQFFPQVLEIEAGQTVRWINKEKRQYHSVWFEALGEEESEYLFPADIWSKRFDLPGEYEYLCGPHPKMTGKIIVR